MKLFLIFLALGLAKSDKLDRTYLPPPGAPLAGGSAGDLLAPLEAPNSSRFKNVQYGIDGRREPRPPGQPTVVPITTTSYAFTQTTTYPSLENYETTSAPIDSITRLSEQILRKPVYQNDAQNQLDYNQNAEGNSQIFGPFLPQTSLFKSQYSNAGTPNYDQNGNVIYPNRLPEQYSQTSSERTPLGQITQITSSGPSINTQGIDQYQLNPDHQNSADGLNQIISEAFSGHSTNQPNQYADSVYSTTPLTSVPSSTLAYSSIRPINRPERPQAEADRNAIVINYENVRTPNGYSYSYDTSNGIHADENGTVGDGTRAQGSYSYIGDDGKIYKVVYIADENGFQPRGDHLPTPPPIPEAIQKVIEQAAKEKAAGIIDDGSYNEEKYEYKNYQRPVNYRQPQIQKISNLDNSLANDVQGKQVKPISKITEDEYDDDELQNQYNNIVISDRSKIRPIFKQIPGQLLNKINLKEYSTSTPGENVQILDDDENNSPISALSNYSDFKSYPVAQEENVVSRDRSNTDFDYNGRQTNNVRTPGLSKQKPPLVQGNTSNLKTTPQKYQHVDKDGYQYNPPQIQFTQTQFPARFKVENPSPTMTPIQYKTLGKGTTLRPFLTPEVYNEPSNNNKEGYEQTSTQRPFVTSEVTPAKDTAYIDYDDGKKYGQKIINAGTNRGSNGNYKVDTPTVPTRSTFSPIKNNMQVEQKQTIEPSYQGSTLNPSDSPLKQHPQFGILATTQRTEPQYQYGRNYSIEHSKPKYFNNYPESQKSTYQYQPNTGVIMTYPITSDGNYPNEIQSVYDAHIPSTPQIYQTSTYSPVLSSTLPSITSFQTSPGALITSGTYETSPNEIYKTGNQYEPIRSNYYGTTTPGLPISGYYPTTPVPVYQQTTFNQNPTFSSTTTPSEDESGTYVLSNADSIAPQFSPIESHQTRYQYRPTSPSFTTTNMPQYPVTINDFETKFKLENPSFNFSKKPALGYIYEPPSATSSTSTLGTTPGYVFSSTTTGHPFESLPTSQDTYQNLVDGFGRPIHSEQQPGYTYSGQEPIQNQESPYSDVQIAERPGKQPYNIKDFPEREQSSNFPKYNNQPKIIGEDFSGPKQPQKFDPETGYHYK